MHGHPGAAPGHYTPFPGPHGPPPGPQGFSRGRALPVMVACGLAMGVFVGLVVVRGTGEAEGAVTATVTPAPATDKPDKGGTAGTADMAGTADDDAKAPPPEPPPPAAPETPPPAPPAADPTALLTFNVTPGNAVVTVDGAVAAQGKAEVKLVEGKARVRLVARADGYKSYEKSHLVTDDEAISIDLVKKARRSSGGGSKGPSGPGGLIDLR